MALPTRPGRSGQFPGAAVAGRLAAGTPPHTRRRPHRRPQQSRPPIAPIRPLGKTSTSRTPNGALCKGYRHLHIATKPATCWQNISLQGLPRMSSPTPSICVFCGARAGIDPAFIADAQAMGRAIAAHGWRLVYGAGDVGLMGEVARACIGAGGGSFGGDPDTPDAWRSGQARSGHAGRDRNHA